MPIEFPCTHCSQTLRVPDAAAGRKARCPACQAVLDVPDIAAVAPAAPPPFSEIAVSGDTPFAAGPAAPPAPIGNPFADDAAQRDNPFASPTADLGARMRTPEQSYRRLAIPLGCQLGFSTLHFMFLCLGTIGVVVQFSIRNTSEIIPAAVFIGLAGLLQVAHLTCLIQGLRCRSCALARAACILSILPCSYCWLLNIGFGIWGLIVLSDPQVRALYRS